MKGQVLALLMVFCISSVFATTFNVDYCERNGWWADSDGCPYSDETLYDIYKFTLNPSSYANCPYVAFLAAEECVNSTNYIVAMRMMNMDAEDCYGKVCAVDYTYGKTVDVVIYPEGYSCGSNEEKHYDVSALLYGYCGDGICGPLIEGVWEGYRTAFGITDYIKESCVDGVLMQETSANCPEDCSCGDDICDTSESCSSCSADCGVCVGGSEPDTSDSEEEYDSGLITFSETPFDFTFTVPSGFTKVEVSNYNAGAIDTPRKYSGWDGYLKINDELIWEFQTSTTAYDYTTNEEMTYSSGSGQWLDITDFVNEGSNTGEFYHYTEGDGIGVKIRFTGGSSSYVIGDGNCEYLTGETCVISPSDCYCTTSECCVPTSTSKDSFGCVDSGLVTTEGYICCGSTEYSGSCCDDSGCFSGSCIDHECIVSNEEGYTVGDGICEGGENCATSPSDCYCYSDSECCVPDSTSSNKDAHGCVDTGFVTREDYVCCGNMEYMGECCDNSGCSSGATCSGYVCTATETPGGYIIGDSTCSSELGETCKVSPSDCYCSSSECCAPDSTSSNKDGYGCVDSGYTTSSRKICCSSTEYYGDCCTNYDCDSSQTCVTFICENEALCGDGECQTSEESCESCPEDCGCWEDECCAPESLYYTDIKGCVPSGFEGNEGYLCCGGKQVYGTCCTSDDCELDHTCANNQCKESGICDYGEEIRPYADCVMGLVSELDPIADAIDIMETLGCGMAYKFYVALTTVDIYNQDSLKQSRKLINEATGAVFTAFVDTADWVVLPLKLWELVGCIDGFYSISGKLFDYIAESIAYGVYSYYDVPVYSTTIKSPVDVMIETESGKFGVDAFGNKYSDFDGALYKTFSSGVKIVMIPNVDPEEVDLFVYGTNSGEADISITKVDSTGEKTYSEFNNVQVTGYTSALLNGGSDNLQLDTNGDGTYENITSSDVKETEKVALYSKTDWILITVIIAIAGVAGVLIFWKRQLILSLFKAKTIAVPVKGKVKKKSKKK